MRKENATATPVCALQFQPVLLYNLVCTIAALQRVTTLLTLLWYSLPRQLTLDISHLTNLTTVDEAIAGDTTTTSGVIEDDDQSFIPVACGNCACIIYNRSGAINLAALYSEDNFDLVVRSCEADLESIIANISGVLRNS